MRAHSSLRLGTLHGTTPELLASPWYCAWGFCMVWEAGLPHKTSSAPPQRRNGRACSSLTARGGGLPVGGRYIRPITRSYLFHLPHHSPLCLHDSPYTFCKIGSFPDWLMTVLQCGEKVCPLSFQVVHDGMHDLIEGIIRRGIDV